MKRKHVGKNTSAFQRLLLETSTSPNVHICSKASRHPAPHTPQCFASENSSPTYQIHIEQHQAPVIAVGHMQTGRQIRSHAGTEAQDQTHGHSHHHVQRGTGNRVSSEEFWRHRATRQTDRHTVRQTETVKCETSVAVIVQTVLFTATLLIIVIHTVRVIHRHVRGHSIDDIIMSSFSRVAGHIARTAFVSDAPRGFSSNRTARHDAMIIHCVAVSIHVTICCAAQYIHWRGRT